MAFPNVIFGPPESMPYELYAIPAAALPQKGRFPLGTQLVMQDGRKFRFAVAGGTLLVVGDMITTATPLSTDEDLTATAGAIGDRSITATHGAATAAANYFSEGFAVISVTPGGGDTYKIDNHLALTSGGADVFNLAPGHALRRALTTASRVDLVGNPYAFVIQAAATTLAALPVGVAVSPIAATSGSGWLQTRGPVGVLTAGTVIGGNRVVTPTGTAGAVGPETAVAANSKIESTVGMVMVVAATGAWSTINLTLDG